MIYRATEPPKDATCDTDRCGTAAMVRLTIPRSQFEAGGAGQKVGHWDTCDLHWPAFRDTVARNGHTIVDATGDPHDLLTEFPPLAHLAL